MPISDECTVLTDVQTPLICHLPPGHSGLHYDADDDLSWKEGEPDA